MGQKSLYLATPLVFNCPEPPTEGFPWKDFRKIFYKCQWVAKVPNAEETFMKISTG